MRGDASGPLPEQHARNLALKLAQEQLVLFAGAGLSRQAIAKDGSGRRLPLWKELAEEIAEACHEDLAAYGGNIPDLFDAIKLGQSRFTLEEAVRSALDDAAFDPSPAHQALAELRWASVYTTNYDGLLGRALKAKDNSNAPVWDAVSEEDQYDRMRRPAGRQRRLFHVHGTLAKPHTLTHEDYRLWPEKNPRAYHHLKDTFLNKTVLFVGYSLSDQNLVDGILPVVRQITRDREELHYAWMWQVSENQAKLFDRREKIEVFPIKREEDWEAAFRQVENALHEVPPQPWSIPQKPKIKPNPVTNQRHFEFNDISNRQSADRAPRDNGQPPSLQRRWHDWKVAVTPWLLAGATVAF